jgi:hypothetical protein
MVRPPSKTAVVLIATATASMMLKSIFTPPYLIIYIPLESEKALAIPGPPQPELNL